MSAMTRVFGDRETYRLTSIFALLLLACCVLGATKGYAASKTLPGTAPGQFSVSRTGAATYQIPIDVPPGVNGLKPALALFYNSQAGNGLLGQGWSLGGLSVISRCPQTIAQDGVVHLPNLTSDDRFCLDGQRLIVTSGNYGAANSVYHTEIDSFQQVTANGTAGTGPASFTVVDRTGMTRQYSTVLVGGDGATPLMWMVTSIKDRYQNFITFKYNTSAASGLYYGAWEEVSEIDYGKKGGAIVGRVVFAYNGGYPGQLRSDTYSQYVTNSLIAVNREALTGITVQDGNSNALRTYTLGYQYVVPTQLTSITECAGDGWCYNPTKFKYSGAATGFNFSPLVFLDPVLGEDTSSSGGYQVVDFDGDGLPDRVYQYDNKTDVAFGSFVGSGITVAGASVATDSQAGIGIQGAVVTDLFADGKQEVLVPYFAHPGISPDTPTWEMLIYDPSRNTVVLQPVSTASGAPLSGCGTNEPGCTVNAIAVDIGRKGQNSLMFTSGGKLFFYNNIQGVLNDTPVGTGISVPSVNGKPPKMTLVNYSGSGQAEIYVAGTGVVAWDPTVGKFVLEAAGSFDDANSQVFFINADGGGLSSAVMVENGYWTLFANTGSGFTFNSNNPTNMNWAQEPAGAEDANINAIDWYGDGRQELLVRASGVLYLFGGDATGSYFTNTNVSTSNTLAGLLDIDGDGKPDFLNWDAQTGIGSQLRVFYNTGIPYLLNEVTDGLGHNTDVGYASVDAAGHRDYVKYPCGGTTPASQCQIGSPQAPPETRPYMGPMYVVDAFAVDSGLSDSNGPEQLFTYYIYGGSQIDQRGRGFLGFSHVQAVSTNSGLYTDAYYSQQFPFTGMVTQSTQNWDSSLTNLKSYTLGSTGIIVSCAFTNPDPSVPICSGRQDWPVTPAATFANSGVSISATSNIYKDLYSGNPGYTAVYAPFTSSSTTQLFDLGSHAAYETTATAYKYTVVNSGTPIGIDVVPTDVTVTSTDLNNSNDSQSIETQSDYSQWEATCPGHPGTVTVIHKLPANSSNGLSQTETFGYDGNCFLTSDAKQIVDYNNQLLGTLTKTYAPDGYGNPVSTIVSDGGSISRTTIMTYDSTKRFPATITQAVTNALNLTESLTYDVWGHKLTDTDANGNTVTYSYDQYDDSSSVWPAKYDGANSTNGFGLKTTQSGPLPDVYAQWQYIPCGSCISTAAYRANQVGSDGSSASTQYDELGRAVRSTHIGFGGETLIQDSVYDLLGRVARTSGPYKTGVTPCWDVKQYDILNRVATEYQPINSGQCNGSDTPSSSSLERTVSTQYSNLQTTRTLSDPSGDTQVVNEATTTNLNVMGKPSSVSDPAGQTSYGYDAWGNLTSVTSTGGASVSMTYDSAGDKLNMKDPDMGFWSYTYDALGELATQTDAKGQKVTNIYDNLGRVAERDELEGATHWVYDIAYGAGLGKLAYTYGPNQVWEGYAYDAYGETTDKITVVNNQEYWVTTSYTDQGQIAQVVYPTITGINVNGAPAAPDSRSFSVAADPNDNSAFVVGWTNVQNGAIYHLFRTPGATGQSVPGNEIYSGPEAGFYDQGIINDGQYTWSLESCNGTNCSVPISQTLTVTLPPTAPGPVVVPASDTHQQTVTLTWAASSLVSTTAGPITYIVQETLPGGSTQQLTATTNSLTVTLSSDGTYKFSVRSSASGVYSAWTSTTSYVTYLAPSKPGSLTVPVTAIPTSSPATYNVTWPASAFIPSSGVIYTLQEQNQIVSGSSFTTVQSNSTVSYSASQTQDGLYAYQVKACNKLKPTTVCSDFTAIAIASVTLPPTNPGTISVTPATDDHSGYWAVQWDASNLNTGSTAAITYQVREELGTGGFGTAHTVTTNYYSPSWHNTNGTYYYEVRACTTDSATGGTACTLYSVPSPSAGYTVVITPPAPVNIVVPANSNLDGSFTIHWGENSLGIAVTDYTAKIGEHDTETGQTFWIDGTCGSATTSCTFNPGAHGGGSLIEVMACDTSVACSSYTQASSQISIVVAAAPALSGPTSTSSGSASLSWTTVSGASSYQLWAATKPASTGTWGSYSQVYSGTATTRTVTVGVLNAAARYYVVACDSVSCTPNSNVLTVSSASHLSGPSSTSDGSIALSWTAISGATSYQLYYEWAVSGGTYSSPTLRATVAGTSYSDTVGILHHNNLYYVLACNSSGCGSMSNSVQVTNTDGGSGCPPQPYQCQLVMSEDRWGVNSGPTSFDPSPDATPVSQGINKSYSAQTEEGESSLTQVDTTPKIQEGRHPVRARIVPSTTIARAELTVHKPHLTALKAMPLMDGIHAAELPELIAVADDEEPDASAPTSHVSARMVYFLSHQVLSSRPVSHGSHHGLSQKSGTQFAQIKWRAPAIDPRLSMYPPLRNDPRIQAHFASLGGIVHGTMRKADCGGADNDNDCSEPTSGTTLMVGYVYNSAGYLAEIQKLDSNSMPVRTLWMATSASVRGQLKQECFDLDKSATDCSATPFVINRSYDWGNGLLTSATATTYAGGAVQDTLTAGYTWDGYNNLLSRSMSMTVPSSQVAPPALSEAFSYDAENRLCDIGTAGGTCSTSSMMTYKSDGSFKSNGVYTGYSYANTAQNETLPDGTTYSYTQPHAVASVNDGNTTRNFTYDADGDLKTESGDVNRTLYWTSFNKPSEIDADSATERFTYGPTRERLQTSVTSVNNGVSHTVTTTYIDGLFESVSDTSNGTTTYKHYIAADGVRVGVENLAVDSGGNVTADTLSFYVRDEVGSVIAAVTENLGGANQQFAVYSYDVWGKSRPTTGANAFVDPSPGTYMPGTLPGQHEGFATHEDLEDIGIVDMEGRIYDPEIGRFLSPDPNVQYPLSSQGYNRYTYVNDNPLSLSDPTGYFSGNPILGAAAAILVTWACEGTCGGAATSAFLAGAADGYVSSGGNLQDAGISGLEAMEFNMAGDAYGTNLSGPQLFARSITEGVMGGLFTKAGGGRFSDGFIGSFISSEVSPGIDRIDAGDYSPAAIAARTVASAVVGGTVSALTGGDFAAAAIASSMQRLFNDEKTLDHANDLLDDALKHPGDLAETGFKSVDDARLAAAQKWGLAGIIANREANWFIVKISDGNFGYTYADAGKPNDFTVHLVKPKDTTVNIVEMGHNHLAGDLNFSGHDMKLFREHPDLRKYDLWMWNQYGHAYMMNYGMIEGSSILQTYEGQYKPQFDIKVP